MGEGGVGRWQERSKKEKQGLGYIWGCMEHCGAGILCSSGSCSVSWRQVSSWTGLVSFLIFCLPTGTSRNSEPWAGTLVGVVRSGCLFLCWTPDYQQTSTSGHISSRWGGGASFMVTFLGSAPSPHPLRSTGTKFSTIASLGPLHHTLLISLNPAHAFVNVPSLTCLKFSSECTISFLLGTLMDTIVF